MKLWNYQNMKKDRWHGLKLTTHSIFGVYCFFLNSWLMAFHKCLFLSSAAIVRGFGSLLSPLSSFLVVRAAIIALSAETVFALFTTTFVFLFLAAGTTFVFLFFVAGCPSSEQWQDGRWSPRCFTNGSQSSREQQLVYSPMLLPVASTVMKKRKEKCSNVQPLSKKKVCGLFEK